MNASMSNAFALDAARVERNIVAITLLLETMSESEDAAPCRIVVVALPACAFGANAFTAVGSKMIQVDSFIVLIVMGILCIRIPLRFQTLEEWFFVMRT